MTETIAYIRDSLKDFYPPGEAQALLRLIMEHVCGLQPHQLLLGKGKDLSDTEKSKIKEIIEGLRQRKPIQYLLGTEAFYGLEFKVTPAVLIPRPETAELVSLIVKDYNGQAPHILDIGTGSGCIAIALAKHLPDSRVSAIDISPEALAVARENATRNQVEVSFYETDILVQPVAAKRLYHQRGTVVPSPWHSRATVMAQPCQHDGNPEAKAGIFDCIVSNPPYVLNREKASMEANVLENEPHLALFVPDEDPLLFYRAIARFGKSHLAEDGNLYFEINALYGPETAAMLKEEGYKAIELIQDIHGKNRMIKANL